MATTSASCEITTSRNGKTLVLAGDWTSTSLNEEALQLFSKLTAIAGELHLDVSSLGRLDTAGAYAILRALRNNAIPPGLSDRKDIARLFSLVAPAIGAPNVQSRPTRHLLYLLDRFGRAVVALAHEAWSIADFVGHLLFAIGRTIGSPHRLRTISLASIMDSAGVHALPIVMVMNFFVGAVVALIGTSLLTSLGVTIFTVQLVGVGVLREFGIIITAVILAGRSTSSFAAQIGSMKMTQEIDAMQVMGVDQFDALVVPRVLGLLWMMPLLTVAGMLAGIAGGMMVSWASLGIGPVFFLERLHETVAVEHFWVGMVKAPVLALLIATAGCRHGLAVGGDVESLGARVTMSVVQAIFMIILFDAIFAILFMELNL